MFLKVRVHALNDATRDAVRDYFGHFDGAVFIVYETEASRSHYQGIVWWEQTIDNLRKQIRGRFKVSGNEEYSVGKVNDYDGWVRYLCKGPTKKEGELPDVVCHQAIDIDVRKRHAEFWEENRRLKAKAKVNGSKGVIETVMQAIKPLDFNGQDGTYKRYEVGRHVVQALKEGNRGINLYQARGIFNAVMMRIDTKFEESFIDEL
ncbi:MAG: hypothetical protein H7836_17320, partial [Magnetococcus sp. YQC-3]